jgi:choline dehydrogenase-like flavoprotein
MLTDARTLPDGSQLEYDVCIVGGGAAGITLAVELVGTSTRVCLLESGGVKFDPATQNLYRGDIVGHTYFPLDQARLRYFGGTTNHWVGDCRPFEDADFAVRPWVPFSGWPFGASELAAGYARASEILDLASDDFQAERWTYGKAKPLPFDQARVLTRVSQFSPPTRFGMKFREDLERAANVHVYLNANVTEVRDARQRVGSVVVKCLSQSTFAVRARVIVVACGGVENARLLLSSVADNPRGLGNDRDLVGRFFMEHVVLDAGMMVSSATELDDLDLYEVPSRRQAPVPPQRVVTKGYLVFSTEMMRQLRMLNVSAILSRAWTPPSHDAPAYRALKDATGSPADLWSHVRTIVGGWEDVIDGLSWRAFQVDRPLRVYTVRFMAEQAPNPDSRVALTDECDALGMRRVKLDWRVSALDYHAIRAASRQLAVECGRSGIGRLQPWCTHESDAQIDQRLAGGAHQMGGTRIHDDPARGVVDSNCRVHGTENVYIAGSSVFPTGGHSAPTMTLVALAVRLARHIRSVVA